MDGPAGPSIDLTPDDVAALDRLRPQGLSRRGVDLATISPIRRWADPVEEADLTAHLGVVLPRFPALTALGHRTSCRRYDRGTALVLQVPAGVDPGSVQLGQTDLPVGWVRLHLDASAPDPDDEWDPVPRRDRLRVRFRDGTPLLVVALEPRRTGAGWWCRVDGRGVAVQVSLPFPPSEAVRVLAGAEGVPLRRP